ncbi:hypothetical protein PSKM_gp66 [Pantoea phage vB_PagM_PSKM]|uniref:Uncharacterized protein n=1 Tax=Pantoea phage vB_PagM_PSKM TaxID=2588094 RepID=A0A513ZYP6_9CAUD|nr:hypothetical protein HWC23_gp66 [Pantoea phage vB_PagM_PSKM]QDH45823.1 hypothetical protein PSKM_gp66 [Pantoea phage vB_PagM_PSKM]
MIQTRKVFVFADVNQLSVGIPIERALLIGNFDYRLYEEVKGQYVFICEREISFGLPDDVTDQAAEAMEEMLSAIRAKHYAEQQKVIDSIAKLRQLSAPKEGELVDDRDLREGQRIHREVFDNHVPDEEAEDAQYSKVDDFPF